MKKIISLLIIILLSFSAIEPIYAYDESENIQIISLSVSDDNGKAVSAIADTASDISVTALIKNFHLGSIKLAMYAVVCDSHTDRVKAVAKSADVTLEKYSKARVETKLKVSDYADIAAGDRIDLFFWDSISGMQQAMNSLTGDELLKYKQYRSNNIAEYSGEKNVLTADGWTYCYTMDSSSVGMCSSLDGNWHLASSKPDNWYITSDGSTVTENGRIMIFNYTVGEFTDGKKIKIDGIFTGDSVSVLTVYKTNDTSIGSIGKIDNDDTLIEKYEGLALGDGKFEITIPANKVSAGNDILFCIEPQAGGYYGNNLDVTISAEETAGYKTNNIKNFSTENKTAAGKWSYVGSDFGKNPFTKNSENPDIGTFSYDKLLEIGDGTSYAENEYAYDLADADKFSFLTSDGKIYTDRALTYVYTLNNKFYAADEVRITGSAAGTTNAYYLTVLKTSDSAANEIGSDVEVLYNKGGRNAKELDITLNPADCSEGNDIIFVIRPLGDMSFEAIETDFTVEAVYSEQ